MKIELILNKKNPDPEQVSWLEVRYPNQNNGSVTLVARNFSCNISARFFGGLFYEWI